MPHGTPSHDTFTDILSVLSPKDLHWLLLWLNDIQQEDNSISIDGKVVEAMSRGCGLTFVQAWSTKNKKLVGLARVPIGSNEISTVPNVLKNLLLKGKLVLLQYGAKTAKQLKQETNQ